MRSLTTFVLYVVLLGTIVLASKPVQNLQVTLRGKKYDVSDVTTVSDLQDRVQKASGIAKEQQGRILFGGKKLSPSDILSEAGVSDGASLNMVPSVSRSKPKKISSSVPPASVKSESSTASTSESANAMQDYLKQAGVDTDKLNDMMKGMGGGEGGEMPSMQESMKMMSDMMNSPIFQEYMNDPEKLEASRKMIIENPMLKSMMAGMPGMEDLLNDPDAWREAMQAAANLYKSMDSEQLSKAMMGGMGGANPGAGLFDGTLDNSAAAKALDELDEED